MRRIQNRDIALGFGAWLELWEAKVYSLNRLREVGNKLRSPELSNAFSLWADQWEEERMLAQMDEAERREKVRRAPTRTLPPPQPHMGPPIPTPHPPLCSPRAGGLLSMHMPMHMFIRIRMHT